MLTLQKGRYKALECIGSGTTSSVERARDNVIGRAVALKTLIHNFGDDLEEQFLREAQLVGQLSHPAIVQLYDVGINEEGRPFLVMEYIAGRTLEEYLESNTLTLQRACAWAADLARAMALAHRTGIIHGDIKPGNIFVTPEEKAKLGDFGIARLATQASVTERVKGTPAPGARADSWRAAGPAFGPILIRDRVLSTADGRSSVRRKFRRGGMLGNSLRGAGAAVETESCGASRTRSRNRALPGKKSAGAIRLFRAIGHLPLSLHALAAAPPGFANREALLVDAAFETKGDLAGCCGRVPPGGCFSVSASAAYPVSKSSRADAFLLSSGRSL